MKTYKFVSVFTVVAIAALMICLAPAPGRPAGRGAFVSPFLKVGPQAIPAKVAGPGYGLFSCQVGLSAGQCYDPYQMRKAYGIDSLISAGKDGSGKTIVILDAFQHPNIVAQLNFFNTFYGLTPVNAGPGTPTFTQVAPDGLTPFSPGDPTMTGWAEEISLDVMWAHAIAPGANIVLELAKDNSDVALVSALNDAINNNRGDVISH